MRPLPAPRDGPRADCGIGTRNQRRPSPNGHPPVLEVYPPPILSTSPISMQHLTQYSELCFRLCVSLPPPHRPVRKFSKTEMTSLGINSQWRKWCRWKFLTA